MRAVAGHFPRSAAPVLLGASLLGACCFAPVLSSPSPTSAPPPPIGSGAGPVLESPLPVCTEVEPAEPIVGYFLVRAGDTVLSTSAGERRALIPGEVDHMLHSRGPAGDAERWWFVLGAPGVPEARVRAFAAQATAAGYRRVSACAPPLDWQIEEDGRVFRRGRGVSLGEPVGDTRELEHPEASPPASVRADSAEVRGSLPREIIQRVVRRHLSEVRFCFEQQLAQEPSLRGRVAITFVIDGSGAVASSSIRTSTLGSPAAEACMAAAVRRWTFPAPAGGGVVLVEYPFVFES